MIVNRLVNRYRLKAPVEIIDTTLGIPQKYKQECIDEIYKIGDSQNQKTNVKAIMSSWYLWKESKVFNPLLNKIIDTILTSGKDRQHLVLCDAWSAIYKQNHHTIAHSHVPSYMSFVYYLQSSGNTPLVFDNTDFSINPVDDTLIVFPAYLIHSVPPHNDEKDRICVAGNIEYLESLDKKYLTKRGKTIYPYTFNENNGT